MRWIAWMRSLCGISRGKDWAPNLDKLVASTETLSDRQWEAWQRWRGFLETWALNGNLDQIFEETKPEKKCNPRGGLWQTHGGWAFYLPWSFFVSEPIDIGEFLFHISQIYLWSPLQRDTAMLGRVVTSFQEALLSPTMLHANCGICTVHSPRDSEKQSRAHQQWDEWHFFLDRVAEAFAEWSIPFSMASKLKVS